MSKRPPLLLVVVLGLAAFLLVTTGFATSQANEKEAPRKKALINQIMSQRQSVGDLDQAVAELHSQVDIAQTNAGKQSISQQQLSEQAATTALQGPSVIVRVGDAPKNDKTSTAFGTDRVQDSDLQLIVNALFASGAQAVALNDNRISAITPIRAAGGTIVVNYRPVTSPYRIVAIGANKRSFEASTVAGNFSQWKKQYNLTYSVSTSKRAQVPAYNGRVSINVAKSEH